MADMEQIEERLRARLPEIEMPLALRIIAAMQTLGDDQRVRDIARAANGVGAAVRAILTKMERLGIVRRNTNDVRTFRRSPRGNSPMVTHHTATFSLSHT